MNSKKTRTKKTSQKGVNAFDPANIDTIVAILKKEFKEHRMPVVDLIQIQTKDPFKVLVTTILSARTKDSTTALAAERLFAEIPDLATLQKATTATLEKLIFPVGFYRNKAIHLSELPGALTEKFGGIIPQTVEELIELPGVGRKTANLVVAIAFDKPAICVDIHVHRICNRLGYIKTKTPFESEMMLRKILPLKHWKAINSVIVSYGQHLCFPINPRCDQCKIACFCQRVDVASKYSPVDN